VKTVDGPHESLGVTPVKIAVAYLKNVFSMNRWQLCAKYNGEKWGGKNILPT